MATLRVIKVGEPDPYPDALRITTTAKAETGNVQVGMPRELRGVRIGKGMMSMMRKSVK